MPGPGPIANSVGVTILPGVALPAWAEPPAPEPQEAELGVADYDPQEEAAAQAADEAAQYLFADPTEAESLGYSQITASSVAAALAALDGPQDGDGGWPLTSADNLTVWDLAPNQPIGAEVAIPAQDRTEAPVYADPAGFALSGAPELSVGSLAMAGAPGLGDLGSEFDLGFYGSGSFGGAPADPAPAGTWESAAGRDHLGDPVPYPSTYQATPLPAWMGPQPMAPLVPGQQVATEGPPQPPPGPATSAGPSPRPIGRHGRPAEPPAEPPATPPVFVLPPASWPAAAPVGPDLPHGAVAPPPPSDPPLPGDPGEPRLSDLTAEQYQFLLRYAPLLGLHPGADSAATGAPPEDDAAMAPPAAKRRGLLRRRTKPEQPAGDDHEQGSKGMPATAATSPPAEPVPLAPATRPPGGPTPSRPSVTPGDAGPGTPKTGGGNRRVFVIAGAAVAVVGVGAGAFWAASQFLGSDPAPAPPANMALQPTLLGYTGLSGKKAAAAVADQMGVPVKPSGATVSGAYATKPDGPVALTLMATIAPRPAPAQQFAAYAARTGATIGDPVVGSGASAGTTCAPVTAGTGRAALDLPDGVLCVWDSGTLRGLTYFPGGNVKRAGSTSYQIARALAGTSGAGS